MNYTIFNVRVFVKGWTILKKRNIALYVMTLEKVIRLYSHTRCHSIVFTHWQVKSSLESIKVKSSLSLESSPRVRACVCACVCTKT